MSFRLEVSPGAEPWAPSPAVLRILREAYPFPGAVVRLMPRSLAQREKPGSRPFSFRAYTGDSVTRVFVDATETPASIAWLVAHELGHHRVARDPGLRRSLRQARPRGVDPASDTYHHLDPEERYADGLATALMGTRLDRDWWRRRVEAMAGKVSGSG